MLQPLSVGAPTWGARPQEGSKTTIVGAVSKGGPQGEKATSVGAVPEGGPPDSLKGGPMIQQVYSHPDIYRIRVDLPDNPLQYLNAYVIKGPSGNLVIDIWKHTKDDWVWKTVDTDEIPKPPEKGSGGGEGADALSEIIVHDTATYPDK